MSEALNRVKESYRQLSAVASSINSASDRLGSSIAPLETGIRKLGLDVSSWVVFNEWHSEDRLEHSVEEIGYTRVGRTWGLAIRVRVGDVANDEESQIWPFNEAPRTMRARSIEKIPDLLEQLVKDAARVEADIVSQVETVEELGEAILVNTQDLEAIAAVFNAPEVIEAPVVTAPVVTAPVVTAPVVTAPVLTAPVVTAPVVTAPVAPVARTTAQADSAAAAAKVRRFLQLKDLSD
jgi:hypothetical protein